MSDRPDNRLRRVLTRLGVLLYRSGLAPLVIRCGRKRVRALLYHSVEPQPGSFTAGLNVTVSPATFAAQLDYLQKHYRVVGPDDITPGDRRSRELVISFDDGYANVYRHALPLLEQRRLPACVYLVTSAVKGRLIWVNLLNYALLNHPEEALATLAGFDPALAGLESRKAIISAVQADCSPSQIEALCDRLKESIPLLKKLDASALYLSADEIREMQTRGISFGFHSRDHYNLRNCDDAELAQQLDPSAVSPLLDSGTFAYPYGFFDARSLREVHRSFDGPIMTVGNNNDVISARHVDRIEVLSPDPAELFAALEVVEPLIAWLRRKTGRVTTAMPTRNGRRVTSTAGRRATTSDHARLAD